MSIIKSLTKRRTYYAIDKQLPVEEKQVIELIKKTTELVPDAFDMKSSRVVVALGEKQNQLWDTIYDVFEGKVAKEKIELFRSGAGTILYYYDQSVIQEMQSKFPLYADNFPIWASQASAMLQISIWSALRDQEIGASLQHYNPIIDQAVRKLFNLPEHYVLVAQMPFGGIINEPGEKAVEDISKRVKIIY